MFTLREPSQTPHRGTGCAAFPKVPRGGGGVWSWPWESHLARAARACEQTVGRARGAAASLEPRVLVLGGRGPGCLLRMFLGPLEVGAVVSPASTPPAQVSPFSAFHTLSAPWWLSFRTSRAFTAWGAAPRPPSASVQLRPSPPPAACCQGLSARSARTSELEEGTVLGTVTVSA